MLRRPRKRVISARMPAAGLACTRERALKPGFRDGPIAIATHTGRLRSESSARYASCGTRASEAAFARRRRRPVGPTIPRVLPATRRARCVALRGCWPLLGRVPLRLLLFGCAARGRQRADGGGWCSDGPVGLLLLFWVDDAGAWRRDAALRRANHMATLTDRPPPPAA